MRETMTSRIVGGLALCLGILILLLVVRFGLDLPLLSVGLICIAAAWLAVDMAPKRDADAAVDYELDLLARLDDPDPQVQRQAELERELHHRPDSH